MLELTELEQAAISGKSTTSARKAADKSEAAEAKQAAINAENYAKLNAELSTLSASETDLTVSQITADCLAILKPLVVFSPTVDGLRTGDHVAHLHFKAEQSVIDQKRAELAQTINQADGSIQRLETENAELATARRNGLVSVEAAGKVGMNLLDIETLTGIKARIESELSELQGEHRDWHGESWVKSVKESRVKALFSVIEVCESVITECLRDLRSTNDVSLNYYRMVKTPWR